MTLPSISGLYKLHIKIIPPYIPSLHVPVFPCVRLLSLSCYSVYTFSISLPATSLMIFSILSCVTPGTVSSNIHSAMKELFVQIPNNRLLKLPVCQQWRHTLFLIIQKNEPMNQGSNSSHHGWLQFKFWRWSSLNITKDCVIIFIWFRYYYRTPARLPPIWLRYSSPLPPLQQWKSIDVFLRLHCITYNYY